MIIELTQEEIHLLLAGERVCAEVFNLNLNETSDAEIGMKRETVTVEHWYAWVRDHGNSWPNFQRPAWFLLGPTPDELDTAEEQGFTWRRCPDLDRTVMVD